MVRDGSCVHVDLGDTFDRQLHDAERALMAEIETAGTPGEGYDRVRLERAADALREVRRGDFGSALYWVTKPCGGFWPGTVRRVRVLADG